MTGEDEEERADRMVNNEAAFWGVFSYPDWEKTLVLVSNPVSNPPAHSFHLCVVLVARSPSAVWGEQQSVTLGKHTMKWQLVLNGDKCGFSYFLLFTVFIMGPKLPPPWNESLELPDGPRGTG